MSVTRGRGKHGAWATRGAAALAAVFAGAAWSQPGLPPLTPVDQQFDDVSPLSNSLRVVDYDLRRPFQFERVYRIDPTPRLFGGEQKFARIDNGVIAVFDRSQYVRVRRGLLLAEVPVGTVFYLGSPESVLARGGPTPPSILTVDMSAGEETLRAPGLAPKSPGPEQLMQTVFSGEAYRVYRVGQLLDIAGTR